MKIYPELEKAFQVFRKREYGNDIIYRQQCFQKKLDTGAINKIKLIEEFKAACADPLFDWQDIAERSSFMFYFSGSSRGYVIFAFEVLVREFLFPEKVMTKKEFTKLETLLNQILNKEEWTNINDFIKEHASLFERKVLDHYNISRYYRLFGNDYFVIHAGVVDLGADGRDLERHRIKKKGSKNWKGDGTRSKYGRRRKRSD